MNSINTNNLGSKSLVLYMLIICNIVGFSFYVVNAIRYQAPLLSFWLPTFAFFVLYGYISADESKKLDIHPMTGKRNSSKFGIVVLLLLIFILATKNWKASPLDFSDAFILALFLSNTKDHIVEVLAIRKFADTSDQK